MAPMFIDPPVASTKRKYSTPVCSDPSVVPSENASTRTKELWWLHGHPHSKRYSDPRLVSLAALIRHCGILYNQQPGFLYPTSSDIRTAYSTMTWDEFDRVTDSIAASYAHEFSAELREANESRKQPTVALLGTGTTLEYFCTELALQKLGIRVLLLAESNAVNALHHLLVSCHALVVITDSKNVGADTKNIRKVSMIEELPRDCVTKQAEIEAVKFQDYGDVWDRHAFIIHSSGSTGLPKPVMHTNRSLMLIARMYRLFQEFDISNWFLLFPLYHIAGISIALSGLPNGQILSFPPVKWPPSSSAIFAAMNTLSKQGFLVDTVHCAPTLIINMYEYIMGTTKDFTPLSSLKILQPGGAVLSSKVLDALVAEGVNVKTTYGTTEIGPPFRTIPSTRDNPNCYSLRNLYPDNDKLKMEEVGEDLYELVVYKGFDLAADLWEGKPDDEPYRTNDLFFQEPPGSGFFAMRGRKDDVLVHSNGENTSAGPLQLELQSASKIIKRALVLGHSKPCVCLLVELNDEDSTSDSAGEEVWGIVKQVNERYPGHSRIMRSMIYILPKGSSLPVTPKGNVRRTEAERIFHDNISQLYDDVDHNPVSGLEDSEEPLEDFLRNRIADLAGVPLGHVKNQTTLYALNIDSRLALSLRASLSKRLGPVSLGTIFENPSIDKLLSFFQKKGQVDSKEAPSQIINQMISKLNAELSVWPTHSSTKKYTPSQTETVLLTGASGFLGTGLLESLTASPRITKIYAMIRGPNNEAKLRKSSTRRGLDVDKIMGGKKIEVLNYNMQDTSLGLECSDYTRLAQTVTIVVHTAWKMDFNQGVEYFEDDCIRSTMSLLRLCHTSRHKVFAFTSSISTCMSSASPSTIPETPISSNPAVALNTGYAQSKYIIERITQFAATTLNIPVRLLRVGQLCGNTKTGHWNADEMWPILFATSAKLGAVPVFPQKTIDWIPVNVAAQTISDILLQQENPPAGNAYTVHNIVNPHPVTWSAFIAMLQRSSITAGAQMEEVDMQDWVRRLNAAAEAGASPDDIPALRLLRFFEDMAGDTPAEKVFETQATRQISAALRTCPGFCDEWIARSVEWWKAEGFLV